MADHTYSGMLPNSSKFNYESNGKEKGIGCGVEDEYFPSTEKCFYSISTIAGTGYEKICPDCSIWTPPPDSVSLEATTIFECHRYGYCRRIRK
jgi:hypothetical protein